MDCFGLCEETRTWTIRQIAEGLSVGFVPTMGALHEGHLSLIRASVSRNDRTIASIFVNPTQFGVGEDLDRYPRPIDQDLQLLREAGASAVFTPSAQEMYPDGFSTFVQPPEVAKTLEGICRPGHFQGVTTIVLKLFAAIPASRAYFGRKDYQQLCVIRSMTRDLNLGIEIIGEATVREHDGLAMSSRNQYLTDSDRSTALALSAALNAAKGQVSGGEHRIANLNDMMRRELLGMDSSRDAVDKIDYATIVDAENLSPVDRVTGECVALIAAWVGKTRLIDNCILVAG